MDLMPPFEFNVFERDSEKRSPDCSFFAAEAAGLKSSSSIEPLLDAACAPEFSRSLSILSSSAVASAASSSFSAFTLFLMNAEASMAD